MFSNIFPHFEKGKLLKKEMLEVLRDYPRTFFEILYEKYSDGLIVGCEIRVQEEYLFINKGIVKNRGVLYILQEEIKIKYENSNKEMILKIKFEFKEKDKEDDFTISSGELFLSENLSVNENEIELARFKLREGAKLRSSYNDFFDFSIEYNMINIINVKHSTKSKPTINPMITKYFADKIQKKDSENIYDISFLILAMNSNIIEYDVILFYLKKKISIEEKELDNLEIYKYMGKIIKNMENEIDNKTEEVKNRRQSRIIVD